MMHMLPNMNRSNGGLKLNQNDKMKQGQPIADRTMPMIHSLRFVGGGGQRTSRPPFLKI